MFAMFGDPYHMLVTSAICLVVVSAIRWFLVAYLQRKLLTTSFGDMLDFRSPFLIKPTLAILFRLVGAYRWLQVLSVLMTALSLARIIFKI